MAKNADTFHDALQHPLFTTGNEEIGIIIQTLGEIHRGELAGYDVLHQLKRIAHNIHTIAILIEKSSH